MELATKGELLEVWGIPPQINYPNWIYFCPGCLKWWKEHFYHQHYVHICPDCRAKLPCNEKNGYQPVYNIRTLEIEVPEGPEV